MAPERDPIALWADRAFPEKLPTVDGLRHGLRWTALALFVLMAIHGAVWCLRPSYPTWDLQRSEWYGFVCFWMGVFGIGLVDITMLLVSIRDRLKQR